MASLQLVKSSSRGALATCLLGQRGAGAGSSRAPGPLTAPNGRSVSPVLLGGWTAHQAPNTSQLDSHHLQRPKGARPANDGRALWREGE